MKKSLGILTLDLGCQVIVVEHPKLNICHVLRQQRIYYETTRCGTIGAYLGHGIGCCHGIAYYW